MDFDDDNAVCEKIINDINAVFNKDRELAGFEIIPMPSNQNKSPVVHIEHNLGLESWCIKHVYLYSHQKILDSKQCHTKYFYNDSLMKYINCALLINPDCSTFWNTRRQLVEKNKLNITKEFQFSSIILCRKPKSAEAFAYRRWLFLFQSEESIDWTFELRLCERCADKNTSNYHAWTHRQWVIQKSPHLLKYELYFTEKFIRKHISDYCCYHHRQFIFKQLLNYYNYLEEDDDLEFKQIIELIKTLDFLPNISSTTLTNFDLLKILLPNLITTNEKVIEIKLRSILFFINLLAYDLNFCTELRRMFGNRESFRNHYRITLKSLFDYCQLYNSNNKSQNCDRLDDELIRPVIPTPANIELCGQTENEKYNNDQDDKIRQPNLIYQEIPPLKKLFRNSSEFLVALKKYEEANGDEIHLKWCKHFLVFN